MVKALQLLIFLTILIFICQEFHSQDLHGKSTVHLRINATEKFQQMDGFGMNINTAWWYDGKYGDALVVQPAIDRLIDSMGLYIFRAVIEEIDWEEINDNTDPNTFNWKYYNKIFSDARFEGVWNTLHYLNSRGITKGLILSFMGAAPAAKPLAPPHQKKSWMGGTDYSINPSMEDEFVESIAALLYYARHKAKIEFTLVSPMNETEQLVDARSADHPNGVVEGPNVPDAVQFVRIVRKLAQKLDAIGMSDIRFVTPDAAGERLFGACLKEMVKDTYIMGKLAQWGVHAYGNNAKNYSNFISKPENTNKSFWVTETAGIGNVLRQLGDNAKAYIFWDGFDCVYHHARRNGFGDVPPNDWVFWQPEDGKPMLEYTPSTKSWTPRKQFYQFAQLFRFVKPGAIRIATTDTESSLPVRSFINPDGQLVIVGFNSGKDTLNINCTLDNMPAINTMEMVCTSPQMNLHNCGNIIVTNNILNINVPPDCIFTLTGYTDTTQTGASGSKPEPADWYAGDMHVHRNCGEGTSILAESEFTKMMEPNDLAVISVLADMGDGEVKDWKEIRSGVTWGTFSKRSDPESDL